MANRIAKGKFTLRDFYVQLQTMMKMGPMDKVRGCDNIWEYTEATLSLSSSLLTFLVHYYYLISCAIVMNHNPLPHFELS